MFAESLPFCVIYSVQRAALMSPIYPRLPDSQTHTRIKSVWRRTHILIHVRDPIPKSTSFLEEQNSYGNKLYFLVVIHTGDPNIIKKVSWCFVGEQASIRVMNMNIKYSLFVEKFCVNFSVEIVFVFSRHVYAF